MALTIVRTARASVVKENMDFSTALVNPRGEVIAQGLCQPRHMCAIPFASEAILRRFGGSFRPGDVIILNDPYEGGTHLPDILLFKPVFMGERLLGFSCSIVHHTDIGGRVAGGNASDSTEIFQEGLCLPPVKLYDAGKPNEAVFRIIERNVRVPDKVLGDLRAQISACTIGERGLLELARRYGPDRLGEMFERLLDYTERLTRAELRTIPDGSAEFTDYIDDDGITQDPIRIYVRLTKEGDSITADFRGTSPQTRGAINSTLSYTTSITYACIRSVLGRDIPNNAGFFRPIRVIAEEGSFVHPRRPAPVAARGLAAMRITETLFGALAQMLPGKVFACGVGLDTGVTIAGYDDQRRPFVFLEFLYVSWGGGPDRDGIDGCSLPHSNYSNAPVEVIEAEQPLMILQYGFVPDSGGPGQYRGGLAMVREYRLLAEEATLQLRSDRRRFLPYGLWGGKPGTPSLNILNPGTDREEALPSKFLRILKRGDVFRHRTAGAGGWGDPLLRDPERVLEDVRNEKLTPEHARREYGVVIVRDGEFAIDYEATGELRERMRWEREGSR
jgi:N-methylhydantoinase B